MALGLAITLQEKLALDIASEQSSSFLPKVQKL